MAGVPTERSYRRVPSAVVLLLAAAACSAYALLSAPRPAGVAAAGPAAEADAAAAAAPGAAGVLGAAAGLEREGRFAEAAACYEQLLAREPYHREARFRCALALARAGDPDRLHAFMTALVYEEPRLAAELFRHPALAEAAARPAFGELAAEARAQAND